ncbi:LytTR family DNA-binding domain-containing protein [Pontibacter sp. G13]|uniref:LytR/AlgR family response regulator transcription factor n=1 Tax=Pontibacter sp. G13 TaxID=3074898 RepID=UPI00288A2499|nr:LytTR family DNA-binding domain-containing protein [Pontibacter sp. G13]WNJ18512.1 LytTR family DNA-binding domain-containing protein [Pontibacter sp. G13]
MKIRCMIVDDEPLALEILESYIDRLDNLELVAKSDNAIEAFNLLHRENIDLLFLDIQMPKLTGIELLRNLSHPPKVVFTTAYRDYALEGYELNVVDYLLKPIPFERFLRTINKIQLPTGPGVLQAPPMPSAQPSAYQDAFIYLKSDKKMVKVLLKDVLYIESLKDYIRVRTKTKSVTAYQRISYMEEKLPEHQFLRVHRSFIVALDKIEAFSNSHVEIQEVEIPIGRNYRSAVLKTLNQQNFLNE